MSNNTLASASQKGLGVWLKAGIYAGLAGGLAEVVFMSIYCLATGRSSMEVLSLITLTFFGEGFAYGIFGAAVGISIHIGLSMLIGVLFGAGVFYAFKGRASLFTCITCGAFLLTAIWAFNFLALLPEINPAFTAYVPAVAGFVSKMLFGLSTGTLRTLVDEQGARAFAQESTVAHKG